MSLVGVVVDEPRVRPARRRTTAWLTPIRARRLTVLGLTAVLALPVLVALAALHSPRWLPLVDMAQMEMRVRDVPTGHPPLLGLGGRIRGYDATGSHPGPLAFYLLWPVYQLLGADGWAMQAASAALCLLAAGLAVWIAHRRGGPTLALGTATALAVLLRAYGAVMVTEPWNPRLPVVWWVAFLLAVWSVLCGDLPLLPVVVVAGTFCVQTHIPYLVLVGGLWALVAIVLVHRARRGSGGARRGSRRRAPGTSHAAALRRSHDPDRRALRAWGGASAVVAGLLWLPPLVEQLQGHPGNLAIIIENFRHPYDDRVPFGEAAGMWLRHLDVSNLVRGDLLDHAAPGRGAAFFALWSATAVLAWRRRHRPLLDLHLVLGTALVLGLVAVSRIFGPLWPCLVLWAWGTTTLMALAAAWTLLVPAPAPTASTAPADHGAARTLGAELPARFALGGADPAHEAAAPADGGNSADSASLPADRAATGNGASAAPTTDATAPGNSAATAPTTGPATTGNGATARATAGDLAGSAGRRGSAGAAALVPRHPRVVAAALGTLLVAAVAVFGLEAPDTEMEGAALSRDLAALADPTVARLHDDPARCGDRCTYLVTWTDSEDMGAIGYGMLLELERRGFRVRAEPFEAAAVRTHRTAARHSADAELHLASGALAIDMWQARPGTELVALVDPHTTAERDEYWRIRHELLAELEAGGLDDLARHVAGQEVIESDPRMSSDARTLAYYANLYDRPSAVFLAVPEA